MSELAKEIVRSLPKWIFVGAFCLFVVSFMISLFYGTFMIAGYEFGFIRCDKTTTASLPDTTFTVKGTVVKSDDQLPVDVMITMSFPPFYPSGDGSISGLEVWRNPEGKFPVLAFCHDEYSTMAVDLNDPHQVIREPGNIIRIQKDVMLKLIGRQP